MPVQPITMVPALTLAMAGQGIAGVSAPQLSTAISSAVIPFLQAGRVVTVATGQAGSGTGTGKLTLNPVTGVPLLTQAMAAQGLLGPSVPGLASGIINGLAADINLTNLVQTIVVGVSVGSGIGSLQGLLPQALTAALAQSLPGAGLTGPSVVDLSVALGNGLTSWFVTGTVNTVIVGQPVPPPLVVVGSGTGQLF